MTDVAIQFYEKHNKWWHPTAEFLDAIRSLGYGRDWGDPVVISPESRAKGPREFRAWPATGPTQLIVNGVSLSLESRSHERQDYLGQDLTPAQYEQITRFDVKQAEQAKAEEVKPQEAVSPKHKRQLEEYIEFNDLGNEAERAMVDFLKRAIDESPEYAAAARAIAWERGIDLDQKPPDYSKPIPYDEQNHLLLCDEAHKSHLYKRAEYGALVDQVKKAGIPLFQVICPEWPPVPRSPLVMLMSTSGGTAKGPFDDKPWVGTKWACERTYANRNAILRISNKILPPLRQDDHDRVAYRWQVPCFNPARHIRLRAWCEANGLDITDVVNAEGLSDTYVSTVNPYLLEEMKAGSFSGRCRSILRAELPRLEHEFLGGRTSRVPRVPAWPGWDYRAHANDDGVVPAMPGRQEAEVYDMAQDAVETPPQNMRFLEDGARVYPYWKVEAALRERLPNVRFFGGRLVDSEVIGITREALGRFLALDKTNKMTHVRNVGGRSIDCDDFAVGLRWGMSRQGIHSIGVVGGDTHAFCVVVLNGGDEPDFEFIEADSDATVPELTGRYSVENRCDVFL